MRGGFWVGRLFLLGTAVASCGGTTAGTLDTLGGNGAAPNACGGSGPLTYRGSPAAPADPCGPCLDGALVCASANVLACVGALSSSVCANSTSHDAGVSDAPPGDATMGDASGIDATTSADGGAPDGAPPAEGGPNDSGAIDAPTSDAPLDAGPYDGGSGWQSVDGGVMTDTLVDGGTPDGGLSAVACLELSTSDLVLDPVRSVLYASVTSTSATFGNSVVRVDPSSVTVTGTVFAGSNPGALAISDDGASLYVGLDGTASVMRFDPATGYHDPPVYLGATTYDGPRTAREIRAVPGSATRYVVSRRTTGYSPSFAGLALFTGSRLVGEWNGFVGGESVAFVNASVLYGYNNEDTGFDLYEFAVTSTGLEAGADTQSLITGFNTTISAQGGWVFATSGQAVDGLTMQPVGQYAASGPLWATGDGSDVWFLTAPGASSTTPTLLDFQRSTFLLRRSIALPSGISGQASPLSLIGWSANGFALRTSSAVCIVNVFSQ